MKDPSYYDFFKKLMRAFRFYQARQGASFLYFAFTFSADCPIKSQIAGLD